MWLMIIMMHVGGLGSGNSNALTVAKFQSKSSCEDARPLVKGLASGTVKEIETVCVKE